MIAPTTATDVRLVPAALTSWAVTASAILWGPVATTCVALTAVVLTAVGIRRATRPGLGPGPGEPAAVRPGVVAVVVVGFAFAVSAGLRADAVERHPLSTRFGATVSVTLAPIEVPRPAAGGRVMFRGVLAEVDGHRQSGRVLVFASGAGYGELTVGRPAAFRARISRPLRRDLSVAVLSATGAPRLGRASPPNRMAAAVRRHFADATRAVLPADQAAMLPALVLGDTTALDGPTTDEFRIAGLTHLTAVSGANVTIVCGAVLLSAMLVGPRAAVALAALALVVFVVVVAPSASVLRAAIMGGITLLAVVSHRRRQAIPALSATVIAVVVGWPEMAVDVGFALSVSATGALIVVAPVWSNVLVARGWPKPLADAVSVAVAAQLVTAPLVAGISGILSVVSVAANLAVAAVIAPITVLGTCAAALAAPWPDAAELLIRFTGPELWWLLRVSGWAASVPGAAVPVPSGLAGILCVASGAGLVVALARRRWGRRLLACGALCAVAWAVSGLA